MKRRKDSLIVMSTLGMCLMFASIASYSVVAPSGVVGTASPLYCAHMAITWDAEQPMAGTLVMEDSSLKGGGGERSPNTMKAGALSTTLADTTQPARFFPLAASGATVSAGCAPKKIYVADGMPVSGALKVRPDGAYRVDPISINQLPISRFALPSGWKWAKDVHIVKFTLKANKSKAQAKACSAPVYVMDGAWTMSTSSDGLAP